MKNIQRCINPNLFIFARVHLPLYTNKNLFINTYLKIHWFFMCTISLSSVQWWAVCVCVCVWLVLSSCADDFIGASRYTASPSVTPKRAGNG